MATGSASTSFVYDGTGLRQSETAGSATTYFTWGTEGALPLLLSDGANSYIYGPAGTPVEQVSSSGTPTYLLADQLGSTRALTNASGSVTATFSYDAWGNLTGSTGSATTPFMYAGQYYDSATGLYYMQARYYDPASGQFLSLDPDVGLTQAPYNYAGDDPVNGSDPTGRFLQSDGGGYAVNEAIPSGQMAGSSVAASPCGNGETFNEEEESEGGEPGPGAFGPSGEGGVAGVEGGPPDVYGFASSNVWYRLDALRTSLGANVVAELDIGDYSSLGSNLARSNAPIPGTFRFFVEHAEGDAFAAAIEAQSTAGFSYEGLSGTLYVTEVPCGFCYSGISTAARLLGLSRLEVLAPEGIAAQYTEGQGLKIFLRRTGP